MPVCVKNQLHGRYLIFFVSLVWHCNSVQKVYYNTNGKFIDRLIHELETYVLISSARAYVCVYIYIFIYMYIFRSIFYSFIYYYFFFFSFLFFLFFFFFFFLRFLTRHSNYATTRREQFLFPSLRVFESALGYIIHIYTIQTAQDLSEGFPERQTLLPFVRGVGTRIG